VLLPCKSNGKNIGVTALQKQLEKHLEIRTKATTTTKEELHKLLLLLLQKRNCISRKIRPVHPAYNPYFSACFFSRNSNFSLTLNRNGVFQPAYRKHILTSVAIWSLVENKSFSILSKESLANGDFFTSFCPDDSTESSTGAAPF
jgi:hypothetical protein